ncbi:MAG: ATPase, T2SS/T4P/T4SS family, partial [Candidatus Omnitrophota bacterium]
MALSLTKKLCDLLIKEKLVSEDDFRKARKVCVEKGGSLSDILVKMNVISKDKLLTAMSEMLGFPPINLSRFNIAEDVLGLIPKEIAVTYQMLAVSRIEQQLTVAMVDPLNIFALNDLNVLENMSVSPVIAGAADMKKAISKYYEASADDEISTIVQDIENAQMEMVTGEGEEMSSVELLRITEEAPVVKLTNMIVRKAVQERASDILIEPMEENTRVRYRIDGMLHERYSPPGKFHQALVSRIKVVG